MRFEILEPNEPALLERKWNDCIIGKGMEIESWSKSETRAL